MPESRLALIAIGGNSLIRHQDKRSVPDQYAAVAETMSHVAEVIAAGHRVVITHGNGPQVGFIMLRSEIARTVAGMHIVPLVSCVADTQGAIGYQIQQSLDNELRRRGLPGRTVSLVTQTLVAPDDPGFAAPSKFVGEAYSEEQLPALQAQHPDWLLKPDAKKGWRRVVASPAPLEIVELDAVRALLNQKFHVVACGGGGIPVIREADGSLSGVDAVIDKDLASCLLALALGAELFVISTAVSQVSLHYGSPDESLLGTISVAEAEGFLREGHFPPGNMGPKIEAAIRFIRGGGKEALITCPENLYHALNHQSGTRIVP